MGKDLHDALKKAFQKLQDDQAESPDWHPISIDLTSRRNDVTSATPSSVQNLVHPSMYPLVYGRSKVVREEIVGVEDAIYSWAGKGDVIPRQKVGSDDVWSKSFQWLPSNVAFQADGSVKFTSYINNLHPNKYPVIYSTIEKLIETALPAWNQCLLERITYGDFNGPGRKVSRFALPSGADDDVEENWSPFNREEYANMEFDLDEDDTYDWIDDDAERKWMIFRTPVLREPNDFEEVNYEPSPTKHSLFEKFKDTGLQIIVKMASIELTPEKPEFPAGGWHVEGQLNEHICATALYYVDSENITDSTLSFRMQTDSDQDSLQDEVGQDSFKWM